MNNNNEVKEALNEALRLAELINFENENLDFYRDELEEVFKRLMDSLIKLYGLQELCKKNLI